MKFKMKLSNMGTAQRFPNEGLIKSLCESARMLIQDRYPDHVRLWTACNQYPRVKHSFDSQDVRVIVEYSMIFRRAGGKIYKTVATHRLYKKAIDSISVEGIEAIVQGWTKDFIEKVDRARKVRDEIVANSHKSVMDS